MKSASFRLLVLFLHPCFEETPTMHSMQSLVQRTMSTLSSQGKPTIRECAKFPHEGECQETQSSAHRCKKENLASTQEGAPRRGFGTEGADVITGPPSSPPTRRKVRRFKSTDGINLKVEIESVVSVKPPTTAGRSPEDLMGALPSEVETTRQQQELSPARRCPSKVMSDKPTARQPRTRLAHPSRDSRRTKSDDSLLRLRTWPSITDPYQANEKMLLSNLGEADNFTKIARSPTKDKGNKLDSFESLAKIKKPDSNACQVENDDADFMASVLLSSITTTVRRPKPSSGRYSHHHRASPRRNIVGSSRSGSRQ